jgi:hypothetical protein
MITMITMIRTDNKKTHTETTKTHTHTHTHTHKNNDVPEENKTGGFCKYQLNLFEAPPAKQRKC